MSNAARVQSIYRAALHRLAAAAGDYERAGNGQGRTMRAMCEQALIDTDLAARPYVQIRERSRR